MRTVQVKKGTSKIFGVVRDKNGKPRVDGDPQNLDPGVMVMLTSEERAGLGLYDGPICRDAQGVKHLTKGEDGVLVANSALVAVNEIWVDGEFFKPSQRFDVPEGGTIKLKEA